MHDPRSLAFLVATPAGATGNLAPRFTSRCTQGRP
jgi:hypothetical protein